MLSDRVEWIYRVKYSFDVTTQVKSWSNGLIKYYPAEQKVALSAGDDLVVDEKSPVYANDLHLGGELALGKTMVRITSDVITGDCTEEADVHSAQQTIELADDTVRMHEIFWTKDKVKKSKKWNGGWMKFSPVDRLAIFFDTTEDGAHSDRKIIHKKKYSDGFPKEGDLLDTAHYLIEVSAPLKSKVKSITVAINTLEPRAPEDVPVPVIKEFDLLYTQDKVKKLKRWKDGHLHWDGQTGRATFHDEEGRSICAQRNTLISELGEGEEISTSQYIFQVGSERSAAGGDPIEESDRKRSKTVPRMVPIASRATVTDEPAPIKEPPTESANKGRSNSDLINLMISNKR